MPDTMLGTKPETFFCLSNMWSSPPKYISDSVLFLAIIIKHYLSVKVSSLWGELKINLFCSNSYFIGLPALKNAYVGHCQMHKCISGLQEVAFNGKVKELINRKSQLSYFTYNTYPDGTMCIFCSFLHINTWDGSGA